MTQARGVSDKSVLLWMGGGVLALIVIVAILAPKRNERSFRPTIDNAGSAGAKAAYLMLGQLGYKAERWNAPEDGPDGLDDVDAQHTTLIMADVYIAPKQLKATQAAVQRFLERGGRVLDTGGETLLPKGDTRPPTALHSELCYTTPEGQGPLAQAGQVSLADEGAWNEKDSKLGPGLHVEQRCGDDAVVVHYAVGKGEAIWWSSSMPLSNAGLRNDANLRLLLATIGGPGRTVLFDEYSHGVAASIWDGVPVWWLFGQFALIAPLLILSFSRRNGPIRMPVTVPRTSPVEFAESMGHLYQRAGATNAATGMARRRLLRFLQAECGVARITIDQGPAAVAEALQERFGGDWSALRRHLEDAAHAESTELAPNSALKLVQAMDDDVARLQSILTPKRLEAAARETMTVDEPVNDRSAELVSATKE